MTIPDHQSARVEPASGSTRVRLALVVAMTLMPAVIAGCSPLTPAAPDSPPTATIANIPASPPSPTTVLTSAPPPTTTHTPAPTPTAQPLIVIDGLREVRAAAASPQSSAACGVVDTLDFPLDPPDARGVAFGGQDFGVFRAFFDGYHTGEDWWRYRGEGLSFGVPVHSIGYGSVTYTEPNGWGVDQGVVIVRHTFPDGESLLSFYGHLDPLSVVLSPGDCVARGDEVGRIGRPRGSPHLHFEIRTHMPDTPGPGYWSSDPSLAGWKPPSQFIWDYRIAKSPGVVWTESRPFTQAELDTQPSAQGSWEGLGTLRNGTFAVMDGQQLIGIDMLDGSIRWRHALSGSEGAAMVSTDGSMVYIVGRSGRLQALGRPASDTRVTATREEPTLAPVWEVALEVSPRQMLMPLPGNGVAVLLDRRLFGVSPQGEVLWAHNPIGRPSYWTLGDGKLIFSTTSKQQSMWFVDESGPVAPPATVYGYSVAAGNSVLVHAHNGVYRLDPGEYDATLLYALPTGFIQSGDLVVRPDGDVLLAHKGPFGKRLIVLNPDGTVRWERSYVGILEGKQRFLQLGDNTYLTSQVDTPRVSEISLYLIDTKTAELTKLFSGGTRRPQAGLTGIFSIGNHQVLVDLGGVSLTLLDLEAAIPQTPTSP